jgi:type I restriction enzyme S subunit
MRTEKSLSDYIEEISMGPFGSDITVDNYVHSGIPVLNGSNVNSFKLTESSFNYVTEEKAKTFRKAIAHRGDIIVTHRGTLGQIAYIPEDSKFEKYVISQSQFRVKFNKLIDPRYIVYLFHSAYGQRKLLSFKNHVGVPALAQATTNFRILKIAIHEIKDQIKIANVISILDSKIELNNRINAELEAMAKTIYDYWFVQFDFPDKNGKPYKSSGGKMAWNEELKREIPEGWEVKNLYSIANYINGLACQKYRPKSDSDDFLPVIKIREMNDGISINTEKARLDVPQKYIIKDGDVLFSWSATLDVKIWTEGKGALNQHIFKIESEIYPRTFYYFELVNYLQHFKMMAELRKTTMGHITIDHLKTSYILIPALELIERVDKIINPLIEKIIVNKKENQQLASLRDWLLPMLMNGQVKVG